MSPRTRRFLGMLLILFGLTAYIVLVVTLGTTMIPNHWAAQVAFYGIAGIAWAIPLRPVIQWINREG